MRKRKTGGRDTRNPYGNDPYHHPADGARERMLTGGYRSILETICPRTGGDMKRVPGIETMTKHVSKKLCAWGILGSLFLTPVPALALSTAQVFDTVKESVVTVQSLDAAGTLKNQGSGVLISRDTVATGCHVLEGGASFRAGRGARLVPAILSAEDGDTDICLLTARGITGKPAEAGTSQGLRAGNRVIAVGAPAGSEPSLSEGSVARLRGGPPPLIQTTAPISMEMSGGGLFDTEGRLVGLSTLYKSGENTLYFALPVEWIREVNKGGNPAAGRRGEVEWLKRAVALEKAGDWGGLHRWGVEWSEKMLSSADALYFIGIASLHRKRIHEAVDAFRRSLDMVPHHAEAWYSLGVAYSGLKLHDDAIEAYRRALRIKPDMTDAWVGLGVTYAMTGNPTAAMGAARELRRFDPFNADILLKIIPSRR